MAQFLRPDGVVTQGSWTGSHTDVNETSANGTNFVQSGDNTVDYIEFSLTNATDPVSSTGHIVRWVWRKEATGGHALNPVASLYQGTTLIASKTVTGFDTATFTSDSFTLSAGEADSITDYNDLRLRFERAGETGGSPGGRRYIDVDWAELEIPDGAAVTLQLTGAVTGTSTTSGYPFIVGEPENTTPNVLSTINEADSTTNISITQGDVTLTTGTNPADGGTYHLEATWNTTANGIIGVTLQEVKNGDDVTVTFYTKWASRTQSVNGFPGLFVDGGWSFQSNKAVGGGQSNGVWRKYRVRSTATQDAPVFRLENYPGTAGDVFNGDSVEIGLPYSPNNLYWVSVGNSIDADRCDESRLSGLTNQSNTTTGLSVTSDTPTLGEAPRGAFRSVRMNTAASLLERIIVQGGFTFDTAKTYFVRFWYKRVTGATTGGNGLHFSVRDNYPGTGVAATGAGSSETITEANTNTWTQWTSSNFNPTATNPDLWIVGSYNDATTADDFYITNFEILEQPSVTLQLTGSVSGSSTTSGAIGQMYPLTGAITPTSTTSGALTYQWEWSLFDESSALSKMQPANTVGSIIATDPQGTLSVITTPPTSEYGLRSTVDTTDWVEHDIILDKGIPNGTYRIEIVYRLTSGNTMMVAGGIFSWSSIWSADAGTATVAHYNEVWTPTELFYRIWGTNGTVDFNLYSNYSPDFLGVLNEGVEWHSLHVTQVRPDLFTESDTAATNPNCLVTTVENQTTTTGLTISGLTRTTRGFNSADTTNEREWFQKKSIRANTTLQEFAGTGYVSMSTPTGALVVGEAYEFSMSISTNGSQVATLSNWTGANETINQPIQTPSQEFQIIRQRFTASATTATVRLDSTGTYYTSGWRLEHISDLVRTNYFTAFAGNADTPHSTAQPGTGWHSANGGTYTLETTQRYKGSTAIKVSGNASNSYIWEDLNTFVTIGVGETARITGRYYVETASAGQDVLIYNSGGSPGWVAVNFDQTYIGRWVMFEVEYTRQTTSLLDIEVTAGTGTVYIDDLRFTRVDDTITLSSQTTLQLTGAVTTGSTTSGALDTTQPIDGSVATSSAVAGNLGLRAGLTATAAGTSTTSGSATLSASISGAISTVTSLAASILVSANLSAAVATSSTVAGSLVTKESLAASITTSSAVAGAVVSAENLSASVAASSTVAGDLTFASAIKQLTASVSTSSAVVGNAVVTESLSVAISTSSAVSGNAVVTESLSASVAASSTVAGDLTFASVASPLTASVSTSSAISGDLVTSEAISGAVATSSSVSGSLTSTESVSATGAGSSTLAGDLVTTATLVSALTTSSVVSGDIVSTESLAGAISGSSTLVGALDIAGQSVSITGAITTSSLTAGSINTTESLSVNVTGSSTVSGLLAVSESLEATISGLSAAAGTLNTKESISGAAVGSSVLAGALDISGTVITLTGAITTSSSIAGAIITTEILGGTSAGGSVAAGDVVLILSIDGAVSGGSSISGDIGVVLGLDGAIVSLSTVSASTKVTTSISGSSAGLSVVAGNVTVAVEYKPLTISIVGVKNSLPLITGQKKVSPAITGQKKSSIQIIGKNVGT